MYWKIFCFNVESLSVLFYLYHCELLHAIYLNRCFSYRKTHSNEAFVSITLTSFFATAALSCQCLFPYFSFLFVFIQPFTIWFQSHTKIFFILHPLTITIHECIYTYTDSGRTTTIPLFLFSLCFYVPLVPSYSSITGFIFVYVISNRKAKKGEKEAE